MAKPPSSREILTRWQKPVVRLVLWGSILVLGTGLFLMRSDGASAPATWALLAHVAVGILVVPLLLAFVIPHAVAHMRRKPVIAFTGVLVTGVALAAAFTGVVLLIQRSSLRADWIWPVHVYGGFTMLMLYVAHRRYGTNPASWGRLGVGLCFVLVLGGGFGWIEQQMPPPRIAQAARPVSDLHSGNPFGLSPTSTRDGNYLQNAAVLADENRCEECHPRIVEDTARSAHKFASMNNIFYRGTIKAARKTMPLVDTKWCAGCHDPALLFTGRMDDPDLDFDSPEAQMGLTCMACHAIQPRSTNGNADYAMDGRVLYAWESSDDPRVRQAHDILLKAKPAAHANSLRPHNVSESSYCATCHGAHVPPELNHWRFQRVQDEFHDWHNSGTSLNNIRSFYHPPAAKRCQDCHMPLVPDPVDPAADRDGLVRSHLFAAANTALPYLRGDTKMIERQRQFLQNAVRVDVTGIVLPPLKAGERPRLYAPARLAKPAVKPLEIVEAHVVVRSFGVGHKFPGGTKDSNEVWVDFEVAVGGQPAFYASGRIDPETGLVDPGAAFYRAYATDRKGQRVVNRVGPDVYTKVYVKVIGPGSASVVRYRFQVPEGASGTLEIKATLRYRKFMREYIDFLFPESKLITHKQMDGTMKEVDLAKLPIIDMWSDELSLPVTATGTPGPAPTPFEIVDPERRRRADDIDLPKDRARVNDLGIAYLMDMDPHWAEFCFVQVTQIEPDYADGWVNVARVRLRTKNTEGAADALAEAKRRKPGWLKPRFFEGRLYEQLGRFGDAEAAFRDVLVKWPKERAALRSIANAIWEQAAPGDMERPAEALTFLERLITIDPEQWLTWRDAIKIYKALGDAENLEAATRAFKRFKRDDDEAQRAADIYLRDPNLERLAKPQQTHVQPGLDD